MSAALCPGERSQAGFSLLEIVVALTIMSILAGSGAALALRTVRGNQQERTLSRMKELMAAMIGNPDRGTFGYLADMGELPDTGLTQLLERGTQRAATADPNDGVVSGWNGPYVLSSATTISAPRDSWNTVIAYTPGTAQLRSGGPDRTYNTADDIVYPSVVPPITGQISVLVKGQLNDGGGVIALRSDEASVAIFQTRASDNTRAATAVTYPGAQGSGIWNATGLHLGEHGILVTGLNGTAGGGRNYTGSVSRDVVRLSRGTAFVTVVLDEAG